MYVTDSYVQWKQGYKDLDDSNFFIDGRLSYISPLTVGKSPQLLVFVASFKHSQVFYLPLSCFAAKSKSSLWLGGSIITLAKNNSEIRATLLSLSLVSFYIVQTKT